jgi:hypothetical protein
MPRAPLNIEGPSSFTGLSTALSNLNSQIDTARKSSQLAKALTAWKEGMADFGSSLDNDTDYKTYEKRFDLYAKNLQKSVFSQINHKGALGNFELWAKDSLVVEKTKVKHRASQLEVRFMGADYFEQITLAVKREDRNFIIDETRNAIEAGYVDPLVGAKAQEAALEKLDWTTAWNDIVNVEDRDEALSILNATDLSLTKKNTLLSSWKREEVARDAKAFEEREAREEEARSVILSQIREGTITAAGIEASALSTEEQYKWQERLHKRNRRIADGKDNPFNILDPAVDRSLMDRVYSSNPPTEKEVLGMVGEGLTVARAEHWIKQINQPDKGYQRALQYLQSQIMPRQALTVGESSPNSASYWKAVLALDSSLEEKPLTGNDVLEKAMEMAPNYVLTIEEQIEAAKQKWGTKEKHVEEKGWWAAGKDWLFNDDEKPEAMKQMTDEEIVELLDSSGYVSTPEAIETFRKNNGI